MRLVKIKEHFKNRNVIRVCFTDVGKRYAEKFKLIGDDGALLEQVLSDIDKILKSNKNETAPEFVREGILEKIERTTNKGGS